MPSSRIANSSPPRRATVSDGRVDLTRRCAAACSRRSPASWPSESLTFLKLSRSRNMTATRCCERCASASACSTRFRNRLRLASSVSGSWNASLRSCSSSALRSLTSRKLSARPAMAGSSSRLLPTHSSVLRRSPVSTTTSIGPTDAAARRGDLGEERGQPLAVAVGPAGRGGCGRRGRPGGSPKVRSAAGDAKRSWPVDVGDHDHVGGVLDQRRVAGLDEAGRPALAQQRVVAREDALAQHDERASARR